MSKTVDSRVVEMKFDNKQFESNVQTSMSTLDKLKQKLNLQGASKGLQDLSANARKVDMSALGRGVETVQAKFSALQVMGVTALSNITNSAVNAGKRITKALTIDPVKTGFQEYETQINAVQTVLANTQSKGTTLKDVNAALDELNTYADKTIYNFTEMTRNIGTFTAAGVDLETSTAAIKGIANLAAVSGSNSQQASTAMYQLSQALAAGTVKLMDWNSVVNAGMGGQVFQDALKETARVHGIAIDDMIKDEGSFRETLQKGWLSSEILTETLSKFTGDLNEQQLKTMGYSDEQIKSIMKMGQTANDAATKVKTFTQLFDTLKEAAQSGWTQSWEIIVGDFEEAKELLTEISDTFGGLIGNSAEARNNLLQGWKDLGGRTALIESARNTFEGLASILTPIKDAFREIFPPMTAKQLYNLTDGLRKLTEHLKISDSTASKLKSTFKGVFSVLDIFLSALKAIGSGAASLIGHLTGMSGGILGISAGLGEFVSKIRDSIKETNLFGNIVGGVVGFLGKIIDKLKEFGSSVTDSFTTNGLEGFIGFLKTLWTIISTIGSKIIEVFGGIGKAVSSVFSGTNPFDVIDAAVTGGLLVGVLKFKKVFQTFFDDILGEVKGVTDIGSKITGILNDVKDTFKAYQSQLKAGTLIRIAIAIGILAASLKMISAIDGAALSQSLVGMGVLFGELMGGLALFSKMALNLKGAMAGTTIMISMSVAILILASALKKMSSIDTAGITKGLVAVGVLMAELSLFLRSYNFTGKLTGAAIGIVVLSSALLILAKAVRNFGSMKWESLGKGLAAVGALLLELAVFSKLTGNAKNVLSTGIALTAIAASMLIFASAISKFGSMKWSEIGKGLAVMAGVLAELAIATRLMPTNMVSMGAGLVVVAGSLQILASVMNKMGSFSWGEIGKGLTVMGGALLELSIGLKLMSGSLAGSAALLVASIALAAIAPVLTTLSKLSWSGIAKGLIALAGAFAVVGVAGMVLAPLIPTILSLAGAFALFSLSIIGIGIGLAGIAAGFTTLATAGAVGATAFVSALTIIVMGVADLVPSLAEKFAEAIVMFAKVIGECAPQLATSFLKLITEVLKSLSQYAPQIADYLITFLIGIINVVAERVPELLSAITNLISSIFSGIADAMGNLSMESLVKAVATVGLLGVLLKLLSGLKASVPGAMMGLLGLGVLVAELGGIIAALGLLNQIPGVQWLMAEGGEFLQTLGNALGKFVGGIGGGIAEGVTSSLPAIGSDLSAFMTNAKPFFDGISSIDPSVAESAKSLSLALLAITGSGVLDSITSWLTGGSSIASFGEQLVPFGRAMKDYSKEVSGIDAASITASATAAKGLAQVANALPNSGGVAGFFAGENELDDFATKLVPFGKAMKKYSEAVTGIDATAITNSATAAKGIVQVANSLPNSGGVAGFFAGDNELDGFASKLVPFGKSLKKYSESVTGVNVSAVNNSATAAKSLSKVASNLKGNSFGILDTSLSSKLVPFGNGLKDYSTSVSGINLSAINNSVSAAKSLASVVKSISGVKANGVASFKSAIDTLAKTNVSGFVKAFSGSTGKLSSVGGNLINAVAKGARAKGGTLKSTAMSLATSMADAMKSKSGMFTSVGSYLIDAFCKGVKSKNGAVTSAARSVVSGAASGLRSQYGSFYSAGGYVGSGFASGIRGAISSAASAAAAMARAASNAAKENLKIKSPSRVFYQIGSYTGEGFVKALSDYRDKTYGAASEMADSARKGFSKAISRINDYLDGNIESQPTIRPVLDLSDVESNARSISNMLGVDPLAVSNLNAISTLSRRQRNDAGNNEVVSAINKLRKDLGNVGNTYNIDGVTYDDGSNVSNAVKSLIRATRIEGRV